MYRLNYNQLYYFYVVASEGSIKAACKKLHLTQPTISGQLKTLEEDLGFQLFERKFRKLELTQRGKEILIKTEKIFVLGNELLAAIPNDQIKFRNEIRIGVVSSLPNSLVSEFTLSLWKDNTVSAHLIHGAMPELIKNLDEDKVDLVLSDAPHIQSKKYKSINIGGQNLIAIGSEKYKRFKKGFPGSLTGLPYLSFDRRGHIQEQIDFFFKMNNIKPDLIGSVDDDALIRMVSAKGLCFSILPELSVKDMLQSETLFKIGEMHEVISNCWVVISLMGSRRIAIRKLINNYLVKKRIT